MPESKTSTSVFAFIRAVSRHWLTLMGGGAITVALGVFERFSGKNVPLWVYVSILIFFVFFACYLAWRDAKRELANYDNVESRRREYRANRLQSLLNEAGSVEYGWVSLDPGEGLEKIARADAYHDRAKNFVKQQYGPETASRYDKEKSKLLESLLADCYKDNPETLTVIQKGIDKQN